MTLTSITGRPEDVCRWAGWTSHGAGLTAEVTKTLERFGLTSIEETSGGFTAKAQV